MPRANSYCIQANLDPIYSQNLYKEISQLIEPLEINKGENRLIPKNFDKYHITLGLAQGVYNEDIIAEIQNAIMQTQTINLFIKKLKVIRGEDSSGYNQKPYRVILELDSQDNIIKHLNQQIVSILKEGDLDIYKYCEEDLFMPHITIYDIPYNHPNLENLINNIKVQANNIKFELQARMLDRTFIPSFEVSYLSDHLFKTELLLEQVTGFYSIIYIKPEVTQDDVFDPFVDQPRVLWSEDDNLETSYMEPYHAHKSVYAITDDILSVSSHVHPLVYSQTDPMYYSSGIPVMGSYVGNHFNPVVYSQTDPRCFSSGIPVMGSYVGNHFNPVVYSQTDLRHFSSGIPLGTPFMRSYDQLTIPVMENRPNKENELRQHMANKKNKLKYKLKSQREKILLLKEQIYACMDEVINDYKYLANSGKLTIQKIYNKVCLQDKFITILDILDIRDHFNDFNESAGSQLINWLRENDENFKSRFIIIDLKYGGSLITRTDPVIEETEFNFDEILLKFNEMVIGLIKESKQEIIALCVIATNIINKYQQMTKQEKREMNIFIENKFKFKFQGDGTPVIRMGDFIRYLKSSEFRPYLDMHNIQIDDDTFHDEKGKIIHFFRRSISAEKTSQASKSIGFK